MARRSLIDYCILLQRDYEPNWHHELIAKKLEGVESGEITRLMIFMPPRSGKEIRVDYPVFVKGKGWVRHGDIEVGDYVYHPSGREVKVLANIPQEEKCDMRVFLSDGSYVDVHKNHEWGVYDNRKGKLSIVKTREMIGNEWIGVKGKRGSRARYQLPERGVLQFEDRDVSIDPYTLGVWLGDGTTKEPSITFNPEDLEDILTNIPYQPSSIIFHNKTGVPRAYFPDLLPLLKKEGLRGHKFIPDNYIFNSEDKRIALLNGLIDSDGYIDDTGRVRFSNTNREIIDEIDVLVNSLGIRTSITKEEACLSSSGIQGRKDVYVISFSQDRVLGGIKRKQREKIPIRRKIAIVAIKETKPVEGNCIQVDSPDGLYLVGKRFIPTHNSELATKKFPAWYLGKDPSREVICCSYSADLAEEFGRLTRDTIGRDLHTAVFPKCGLKKNSRSSTRWLVGEENGGFLAAGVGGSITGMGANCIARGEKIATDKGEKPIEEIKVGDNVLSFNEKDRKLEFKPVLAVLDNGKRDVVDVGGHLKCTSDHRVYNGGKYVEASKCNTLFTGVAQKRAGDIIPIGKRQVYDLQIKDNNNFFVNGVLVHNCLIIDDPVKNREEANSPTYKKRVWEWFTSTAYTRLEKNGAVILIMCMTGDTNVLMGNGEEKQLKDIDIGDVVATYQNGKITTSTVKNWCSQGDDVVFEIKMKSGIIVKANERHPFLVQINNKKQWVRLKDLKIGDKITRVIGENGEELNANMKDVMSPPNAKDIATSITVKSGGQTGIDPRQTHQKTGEDTGLSQDTELRLKNTKECTENKEEGVQSVDSRQERMSGRTGEGNSALTTTTKQGESGDYSAMTAISQLDTEKQKKFYSKPQSIYEITLDEIIEINEIGKEEVFDVEIEGTENFIANGLVSHNTRWSDDDLAGRLLEREGEKGYYWDEKRGKWEKIDREIELAVDVRKGIWEVVRFPAIATEDEKYRKKGEALWEDKYDINALNAIKSTIGLMDFSALYQQNPVNAEAQLFQNSWFKHWTVIPKNVKYFTAVDPAISQKKEADDSVVLTLCRDAHDNIYVVKIRNGHWTPSQLIDEIFKQQEEFGSTVGVEAQQYQYALIHYMKKEQQLRGKYINIIPIRQSMNKEVRIKGLEPFYRNGLIYHPPGGAEMLEEQLKRFPVGKHDDIIDALVIAVFLSKKPVLAVKDGARSIGLTWGKDGLPILKS